MDFFKRLFCGVIIGIANIIPGVSGGTMAVAMGIYDRLIDSLTSIIQQFRKSITFLIPVLFGMGIGIVGFTYVVEYLLKTHTLPTDMAFIGLIIGGLPLLWKSLGEKRKECGKKLSLWNFIWFFLFFALVIILPLLKGNDNSLSTIQPGVGTSVLVFFIGIIASATMIIPGVSGSMVLMILGYYYGILNALKGFFDALKVFNLTELLSLCSILIPFGIGVLLGIFGVAKLIHFLFQRYGVSTYCGIFGLIFASPFAILYQTKVFSTSISVVEVLCGIVLLAGCAVLTYFLGKLTAETKDCGK